MATASRTFHTSHSEPIRIPTLLIFLPRIDLILSAALLLAGITLPFLMLLGILDVNLWLSLLSFGFMTTGGVLLMTFSGEIR